MVENIDNNIDDKHEIDKFETPDKDFDEEKNQKEIQLLRQENKEAKRKQEEKAKMLFQQNFQNNTNTINGNIKPQQTEKESQWDEKDKEINYVEELVSKNNIEWIYKYLWLDIESINTIKKINSLKKTKKISDIDDFLKNENKILKETQEKYEELHKKIMNIRNWNNNWQEYNFLKLVLKVFNQLERMDDNRIFGHMYKKLMHKKITKNIIKIKNVAKDERKKNLKQVSKYLKKVNKYENWEYINFPNWISFELWKWPEMISWTNIKIWENEFYIKTHIEKNWEYIKYVESLKKARELFEKKWIKIKYCKRCTRLTNRGFIKAYEEKRKGRKKEGWNYEKSNRLKVLEQTESAVVSYKLEKDWESAIRFIDKDSDLYKFGTGEGKELFWEAEMWLDLDLL